MRCADCGEVNLGALPHFCSRKNIKRKNLIFKIEFLDRFNDGPPEEVEDLSNEFCAALDSVLGVRVLTKEAEE